MVRNREEAAQAAEATTENIPGYCQYHTRLWFDVESVGDVDKDGASDAEDGWKSEPASAKHSDRNPPRGTPVTYLGGSKDNGHRAMSLGGGKIRTTDGAGSGRVATVDLAWPEREWGVRYVGWSDTMNGVLIPAAPEEETRGKKVDEALDALAVAEKRAKDGTERDTLIKRAIRILKKIPLIKRG